MSPGTGFDFGACNKGGIGIFPPGRYFGAILIKGGAEPRC